MVALDETMRTDFSLLLLDAMNAPKRGFLHDTVGHLRSLKDAEEYAALKECALLNDAAAQHGFAALREGMTELELQTIIRDYYKQHGAVPEFTIIGFGANGAFPHHHTGQTKLENNMAVLIDTGCRYRGYPSDMTRCGWFGDADAGFLKVAEIVEGAVQAAIAAAKPGVKAAEVDKAARDHITQAGYGPQFLHRLGHGLGIDVHEPPYITGSSDVILQEGNVFSIEPGIYLEGRFGVRLEDIVILRADGAEVLSNLSRDLVVTG
jgi:Xaa-Pro aminopeptidase